MSGQDPHVDSAAFRQSIARFATGVTVISTLHDGKPAGMTASAVASLSLDPVLLLVCVDNRLPTHAALETSRRFVVNVLHEGQESLARRFASPIPNKFEGLKLAEGFDLPVLADALAYFVCDVHERFPGGDHTIFTGLVRDCAAPNSGRPLLYYRSGFGSFEDSSMDLLISSSGLPLS